MLMYQYYGYLDLFWIYYVMRLRPARLLLSVLLSPPCAAPPRRPFFPEGIADANGSNSFRPARRLLFRLESSFSLVGVTHITYIGLVPP